MALQITRRCHRFRNPTILGNRQITYGPFQDLKQPQKWTLRHSHPIPCWYQQNHQEQLLLQSRKSWFRQDHWRVWTILLQDHCRTKSWPKNCLHVSRATKTIQNSKSNNFNQSSQEEPKTRKAILYRQPNFLGREKRTQHQHSKASTWTYERNRGHCQERRW